MATLLRIIFLYIPAIWGYLSLIAMVLDDYGYLDDEPDPNDYKPIYSDSQVIGDRRTEINYYYEKK